MDHTKSNRETQAKGTEKAAGHAAEQAPQAMRNPKARASKGLRPGTRFASQVATLASVFRQYGIVVGAEGQRITPEQLEALAVEQEADERAEEALRKALSDFHVPYTARAITRALQFAGALKGARGALAGNAAGLAALKKARFHAGSKPRKADVAAPTKTDEAK